MEENLNEVVFPCGIDKVIYLRQTQRTRLMLSVPSGHAQQGARLVAWGHSHYEVKFNFAGDGVETPFDLFGRLYKIYTTSDFGQMFMIDFDDKEVKVYELFVMMRDNNQQLVVTAYPYYVEVKDEVHQGNIRQSSWG